jgi:hypothetical protein
MLREIHPGMGMHIISTWVAAYSLPNLGLTFCSMEPFWQATAVVNHTTIRPYQPIHGLPRLKRDPDQSRETRRVHLQAYHHPWYHPLSLENITALWEGSQTCWRCMS